MVFEWEMELEHEFIIPSEIQLFQLFIQNTLSRSYLRNRSDTYIYFLQYMESK